MYRRNLLDKTKLELHSQHLVLIEGPSTKSTSAFPTLTGRTDGNRRVILPALSPVWADSTSSDAYLGSTLLREHVERLSSAASDDLSYAPSASGKAPNYNYYMHETSRLLQGMQASGGAGSGLHNGQHHLTAGSYVVVQIVEAKGPTLKAIAIAPSSIQQFHASK